MGTNSNASFDFDAFLKEAEKVGVMPERKTVRFAGRTWTLKAEMPATVGLYLMSLDENADGSETDDDEKARKELDVHLHLLKSLFDPETQYDAFLEVAGFQTLGLFIQVAVGLYSGKTQAELVATLTEPDSDSDDGTVADLGKDGGETR